MPSEKNKKIAEDIIALFKKHGGDEYAGEKISQLEHMQQAAELAKEAGYDDEMVLAAFLHDIGHICVSAYVENSMGQYGIINHEKIGAAFLTKRGFSQRIIRLVENHVSAKRYLTFKDAAYFEGLSEASKKTLEYQGGKMTEQEALAYEQDDLFKDFIQMRYLDERAKVEDQPAKESLDFYKQLIISQLEKQNNNYSLQQV